MGYQHVDLAFKDGSSLKNVTIFNGSECESPNSFNTNDITNITMAEKDNSQLYDFNITLNNDGFLHAQALIKAGKVSKQSYHLPMTKEYVDAFLLQNDPNDIKKWHLGLNLANTGSSKAQQYNYNQWVFPFTTDFENLNTAALEAAYMEVSKIPKVLFKKYKKPEEIPLGGIETIRTLAKQFLSKANFEIKEEKYLTIIEASFK